MTPQEPLIRWEWVFSHLGDIGQRLVEHLTLAGLAVAIGLVISFGLSLAIRRHSRLYDPVTWITGVLYTIPSLALFALLVPFTRLTILTAEIGLVSYTLLILIRNMIAGFQSVPPEVREAAIGMGYAPNQLLWRVELPLALSVIIAGIRVAAVTTIGLTTVTALIGQGGLGFFILEGIQRFFTTPLIVGAVLSVAVAVVVDAALVGVQRWATPWARARG
jgi:osmoprotectant transport system permease protein